MTPKHPTVVSIETQIERIQQDLSQSPLLKVSRIERIQNPLRVDLVERLSRVETQLSGELQRQRSLAGMFEYYYEEAKQVPDILIKHSKLLSEYYADNTLLKNLRSRKAGAEITRALEVESEGGTRFEKRNPTVVPLAPHKPNRRVLLLLGLILGMAAGAVALFFVEYADRSIRGANDVKKHLGLPLLGTVPFFFKRDGEIRASGGLNARAVLLSAGTIAVALALFVMFAFDNDVNSIVNRVLDRTIHSESRMPHEIYPGERLAEVGLPIDALSDDNAASAAPKQTPPGLQIIPGVFAADDKVDSPDGSAP
jgi:hypothetical protein